MTANEFWKKKFDEYPQTDADKLAVVMMQEYAATDFNFVKIEKVYKWVKVKPKFNKECLVIAATKFINTEWEYNIYQITKIFDDDIWYWGWCNGDGEECGDLEDFTAQLYCVLPLIKKT